MKLVALLGRVFYSLIFLMTVTHLFTQSAVEHASSVGVPYAHILVPAGGILAIAGGLSICFGFRAKLGACLIIIFLVVVTFYMHAFWSETDPAQMHKQVTDFLKNISLLGSALLLAYFGSGPLSLDNAMKDKKIKVKGFSNEAK